MRSEKGGSPPTTTLAPHGASLCTSWQLAVPLKRWLYNSVAQGELLFTEMTRKLLLACPLLALAVQGLRMQGELFGEEEQSELDGKKIAWKGNPWQALMALLLAFNPSPANALTLGPTMPGTGGYFNHKPASTLGSSRVVGTTMNGDEIARFQITTSELDKIAKLEASLAGRWVGSTSPALFDDLLKKMEMVGDVTRSPKLARSRAVFFQNQLAEVEALLGQDSGNEGLQEMQGELQKLVQMQDEVARKLAAVKEDLAADEQQMQEAANRADSAEQRDAAQRIPTAFWIPEHRREAALDAALDLNSGSGSIRSIAKGDAAEERVAPPAQYRLSSGEIVEQGSAVRVLWPKWGPKKRLERARRAYDFQETGTVVSIQRSPDDTGFERWPVVVRFDKDDGATYSFDREELVKVEWWHEEIASEKP